MPDAVPISMLFSALPPHWGLRGDPFLWAEMERFFRKVPCPSSPSELEAAVSNAFEKLTGQDMLQAGPVFIERYSHGGMSSGHVDPSFWRETAIPFLLARRNALHSGAR